MLSEMRAWPLAAPAYRGTPAFLYIAGRAAQPCCGKTPALPFLAADGFADTFIRNVVGHEQTCQPRVHGFGVRKREACGSVLAVHGVTVTEDPVDGCGCVLCLNEAPPDCVTLPAGAVTLTCPKQV
jgi:hypothetical protein